MTFSYDATALDEARNRIRLEIGDTNPDRVLLQDEEIDQIISEQSEFYLRVARCCRLICAHFAAEPSRYRAENFTDDLRDVFERYQKMAQLYEEKAAAPWAGSYLDSFKDATEADTSLVTPLFKRGMHDFN